MTQPDTASTQGEEGNTRTSSRDSRSRKWIFTLNNWTEDEYEIIKNYVGTQGLKYVIGEEIAPSTGTPHLQGFIESNSGIRFSTLKKLLPRASWSMAKGDDQQNLKYCTKSNLYITNITKKIDDIFEHYTQLQLKRYENVKWKPWQQSILNIIDGPIDERKINWIYDITGNVGKSFLCNYIDLKYNCAIADGKKDNILHQLAIRQNEMKVLTDIIILDVPRENAEYINYGLIEQLKNGNTYSGKYEGARVRLYFPHILIFTNFPPLLDKFSHDRWNIIKIDA